MNEHIRWIDGVKGLACLLVFWHHFCLAFLPGVHFGMVVPSHINGEYDWKMAQSPLSFVLNGNFMVAIFCVLSGLLLSIKIFQGDEKTIYQMIIKRYPRLMLPIVPVGLMVFFMLKKELFLNQDVASITGSPWFSNYYASQIPFEKIVYAMVGGIWFQGDDSISTAFWMLNTLFIGSFVNILLAMIVKKYNKHAKLLLGVVTIVLMFSNDMLWAFSVSVMLAYLYCFENIETNKGLVIGILCILAGCLLGGYPSGVIPSNVYRFFNFFPNWYNSFMWIHIMGASLFIYGVLQVRAVEKIFEIGILRFLGKISYSIYLLHIPLLFCVSAYIFLQEQKMGIGYLKSTALCFGLSNLLLIALAFMYYKLVEKKCAKLVDRLCKFLTHEA